MFNSKRFLFFSALLVLLLGLCTTSVSAEGEKSCTVDTEKLNLRSGPGTSNEVIVTLEKGYKLTILETSEDWYKVLTPAGTKGWVHSDYVNLEGAIASRSSEAKTQSKAAQELSAQIISYAKELLGVRYVYGGNTPKGFDCSGFVKYVYNHFDLKIERTASSQAKQGTAVKKAELAKGDLVFFDTNGGHNKVNHVGIYVGDGNFIHSSSGHAAMKVVISNLESGFYANSYMTARRFF